MKVVVAAFNQEKALVGAFSVITNLRMEIFEALVQERLVFWAFPRDERDIRMYSSPSHLGSSATALEYQNSPFCQGMRLLEQGAVSGVLQVGE